MIIQCEHCETRFRLDESRLPPQGGRVRCSRCKTAFFVRHPEVEAEAAIHEVVAEATDPTVTAPPATHDLFETEGADLGGAEGQAATRAGAAPAAAASAPAPVPEPAAEDDELWEFEEPEPKPAPPTGPARSGAERFLRAG